MDKTGTCCICGTVGRLSFEHIPPRAAFNDHGIFQANIDSLLKGNWEVGEKIKDGKQVQLGAGRYSLMREMQQRYR